MNARRIVFLAALAMLPLLPAPSQAGFGFNIQFNLPLFRTPHHHHGPGPRVYVAPAPVYVAPRPVYLVPAPPPPVLVQPVPPPCR